MHGSWDSRLASLSGLERSAAAEEEGRKGQFEGENRRRNLGAVYHGQVEKYFEKGGGGADNELRGVYKRVGGWEGVGGGGTRALHENCGL